MTNNHTYYQTQKGKTQTDDNGLNNNTVRCPMACWEISLPHVPLAQAQQAAVCICAFSPYCRYKSGLDVVTHYNLSRTQNMLGT